MEVSNKFKNIDVNLEKIFAAICENSTIGKYIYYLNQDPMTQPEVTINLYKNGYYFINFFDGNIPDKEQVRLFLNFVDADFSRQPLSRITYLVEILIPSKYWTINGKAELRGRKILDEIAIMIDQQLGYGIGEAQITGCHSTRVGTTGYNVMSANIVINSSTLKGLR